MSTQQEKAVKLKVELGRRTAVWDPNVDGFEGLSSIDPAKDTTAEIDSKQQPNLFNIANRAIKVGVLNIVDKKTQRVKKTTKATNGEKEVLPTIEGNAAKMMTNFNQSQMLEYIKKERDINILESLLELEIKKENNANKLRRPVYEALKEKIEELDEPLA